MQANPEKRSFAGRVMLKEEGLLSVVVPRFLGHGWIKMGRASLISAAQDPNWASKAFPLYLG